MARPLYETADDRSRELAAINRLLRNSGKTVRKLPIRYGVDFAVLKEGEITAWVEVKCRFNDSDKYSTLMISAAKVWQGVYTSINTGKPFFVVAEWKDKIGFIKIKTVEGLFLGFGGRSDRNDAQDVEPVYFIDICKFTMKENDHEN
jgi:hypothetical protein